MILPTNRTILRTSEDFVIVRPSNVDSFIVGNTVYFLSDEGKAAWNRGEDIDSNKHIFGYADKEVLERACYL